MTCKFQRFINHFIHAVILTTSLVFIQSSASVQGLDSEDLPDYPEAPLLI